MKVLGTNWLTAMFAALCLASAVVACSEDKRAPKSVVPTKAVSTAPSTLEHGESVLWQPDSVLVLIPDIAGYFRDCNCAGANIGGLERVPYGANSENPHILFYGATILTTNIGNHEVLTAPEHRKSMFTAASRMWSQLGNVHWIPSQLELRELNEWFSDETNPMTPFLSSNAIVMDGNVSVSLPSDGDNYVKIAVGPQSYRVPGPLRGLSGREVLCIGIWRRHDSGDYSATFSRTAGILAMRKPEVDSPSWKLLNAELCKAERVVSTWKVFLHSNMPKHSRFTTAIDQYEVEIMHGSQLTSPHLGSASADDSVKSCASCHPKAVEQWLTSAHSHAMNNLKAKGQDKNPACLSCHTTPRPESGQKRLPATVGVSCHSCHEKGATPKVRTCERCHTTHTDPERRFFPAFSKVCTGDIVNSSGEMTCECE